MYPDTGLDLAREQREEWGRAEREVIEISLPLFSWVLPLASSAVSSLGLIGNLVTCEAGYFHSICRAVLRSFKGQRTVTELRREVSLNT